LGDEAAEDLVNWMLRELNELNFSRIDARLADLATRAGLAELRREAQADVAELRQEMQAGFARMDAKFSALHEDMHVGLAGLETRFERRMSDLIKWSLVFWVGAVGAIAMLAGVLR
jgi:hypothetical protein